jgi:hypothetical protein
MCFSNFFKRAAALVLLLTLVTACGGGGGSAPPPPIPNNVLSVTVDGGPVGSGYNVNRLYATVKVCLPGSTDCRTIDHVLVDSGSAGLRLLASAISPALNLSRSTGATGFPLLNCAQFVDNSFAWGPVATADIVLGGKTAVGVPIQIMADPSFSSPASACLAGGTALTTTAILGANGIIGMGLFKQDCGKWCEVTTNNGFYYTCVDATCTTTVGTNVTAAGQVQNPVARFDTDNNGVLVDLPAVSTITAPSLSGSLIFGIGTQTNNQFTSGAVLTTSPKGYITTLFAGQSLSNSFVDTGSNGLFFNLGSIPLCGYPATGFYCPASQTTLSATLVGGNAVTVPISFSIENALTLTASYPNAVLPGLSGPIPDKYGFDWGLPFFYGRRVFIGIEGQASQLGTGPYYSF